MHHFCGRTSLTNLNIGVRVDANGAQILPGNFDEPLTYRNNRIGILLNRVHGVSLGLAILVSLAASRTDSLRASGDGPLAALNGGYHAAFLVGALFAAVAAAVGAVLLRTRQQVGAGVPADATAS